MPSASSPASPALPSAHVAVIGAGVVGLAVAWQLRLNGLKVAVVDPSPGGGASRAAAGMLAPAAEFQHRQEALQPLMRASAAEYPGFVAAVEAAGGRRVGYRAGGTLICAADAADRDTLAGLHRNHLASGEVEQLTLRAARRLEPVLSPRLAGALLAPADHQVDPRVLAAGLLAALAAPDAGAWTRAADAGPARLLRHRAAALLQDGAGSVTGVLLEDGSRLPAAATVLATGTGPAPPLLPAAGIPDTDRPQLQLPPVRPVHGDILRLRTPERAPALLTRTVRGLVQGRPVYLVPRADGTVVLGATMREDGMAGVSSGGVFALLRDAQALVPAVADLELLEVMARARPGTPDDLPLLGPLQTRDGAEVPGLVLAGGFFRHGILLAPLAARLAAGLVTAALTGNAGEARVSSSADAAALASMDPRRFTAPATCPVPRADRPAAERTS